MTYKSKPIEIILTDSVLAEEERVMRTYGTVVYSNITSRVSLRGVNKIDYYIEYYSIHGMYLKIYMELLEMINDIEYERIR